jgi:hypothetical protein
MKSFGPHLNSLMRKRLRKYSAAAPSSGCLKPIIPVTMGAVTCIASRMCHFLAEYLPKVVDKLTPEGKVDPTADHQQGLANLIPSLLQSLGGKPSGGGGSGQRSGVEPVFLTKDCGFERVNTAAEGSERSSGLCALLKSTKGVLVVAHGTLWRQSFNYKTPFRAAAIANPFNYLPADNNIAVRVTGDYPRT